MKKALVIFNKKQTSRTAKIYHLLRDRVNKKYNLDVSHTYSNIEISSKNNKLEFKINGKDLKKYSTIFLYTIYNYIDSPFDLFNLEMASLIGHYCRLNNISCINSFNKEHFIAGKLSGKVILGVSKLNMPDFIFNSDCKKYSYKELSKFFKNKTFVVKNPKSKLGREVSLIKSESDLYDLLKDKNEFDLVYFEEFIQHEFTVRGFVCGDKCDLLIKVSKEDNDFKTNHGKAVFITEKIDKAISKLSIKAAKTMQIEIAGVDLVPYKSNGNYKILEVNCSPGITLEPLSPEIDAISDFLLTH